MLIDTHAHVTFSAFKEDAAEVMQRAFDAGVTVINVGTQLNTSQQAVKVAEQYAVRNLQSQITPKVYAVVGLHPVHTYSQYIDEEEDHFKTREEKFDYEAYKKLAENPLVVGIGECGLDYYRLKVEDSGLGIEDVKQRQKDAFVAQIRLAKELNKALVIHCRPSEGAQDAYLDILSILDSEISGLKTSGQAGGSETRFEIHSFTGSPAVAEEFISRGAYIGVNGIITFDKTGNMAEVIQKVSLERIVLETDCPYLTPVPFRGKKNEPSYVQYVAQKLAELKHVSVEEVERVTGKNSAALFSIPG